MARRPADESRLGASPFARRTPRPRNRRLLSRIPVPLARRTAINPDACSSAKYSRRLRTARGTGSPHAAANSPRWTALLRPAIGAVHGRSTNIQRAAKRQRRLMVVIGEERFVTLPSRSPRSGSRPLSCSHSSTHRTSPTRTSAALSFVPSAQFAHGQTAAAF